MNVRIPRGLILRFCDPCMFFSIVVFLLISIQVGYGQKMQIQVSFDENSLDIQATSDLELKYGKNKELPVGNEKAALVALSFFPELVDTKIRFKYKKGGAPFASRPVIWDTFFKKRAKRTYLIFIRTKQLKNYDHLLLDHIPFNALIGVLGHELAHTSDFQSRNALQMLEVTFGNLSSKYLDKFEFQNDQRTIEHGLGFQLLAWNSYGFGEISPQGHDNGSGKVNKMIINERYMYPQTIKNYMATLEIYQPFLDEITSTSK